MAALLAEFYTKYSPHLLKCSPNLKVLVCSANSNEETSLSWRSTARQRSGRRVRFADPLVSLTVDHTEQIGPVDSWLSPNEMYVSRQEDFTSVESNVHVQRYLRYSDVAYIDVVRRRRRHASHDARLAIVQGMSTGYRTLERYSCDSQKRAKMSRLAVTSILAKFNLLQRQGIKSWEIQLCRYSQLLSHSAVRWARYLGEIDAAVAVGEYISGETPRLTKRSDTTKAIGTKLQ